MKLPKLKAIALMALIGYAPFLISGHPTSHDIAVVSSSLTRTSELESSAGAPAQRQLEDPFFDQVDEDEDSSLDRGRPSSTAATPQADNVWQNIGADVSPGRGAGTGGDTLKMDEYEAEAKKAMDSLTAAITAGRADTRVVTNQVQTVKHQVFMDVRRSEHYSLTDKDVWATDALAKVLTDNFKTSELGFELTPGKRYREVTVWPTSGETDKSINYGTYDPQGNLIIYQNAFKKNDNAPEEERIPLNEMGLQLFLNNAGDNAKNLKVAFLTDIQNKAFWDITRQNYNDLKTSFDHALTFSSGSTQFNRYMGSPSFNSKFSAFMNHHNALGHKIPDKIIVVPQQAMVTRVGGAPKQLLAAVIFKQGSTGDAPK